MIPESSIPASWRLLRDAFLKSLPNDAVATVGVVVGCSGGADSVALTRLMAEHRDRCRRAGRLSPPLRIAHFNHGLRGDASDTDEQFVRELAVALGLEFEVGRANPGRPGDAEATLRQDRRQFFHDVAARTGCRYVALAHTADDQAETILHHLLRGSGTLGMAGMRLASPLGSDFVVLRPLLHTRRNALRRALADRALTWREDASNQSTRYTRNWIRHDVLPLIHTRFPQADRALVRVAETQRQLGEMLTKLATLWLEAFIDLPVGPSATQLSISRPVTGGEADRLGAWPHGQSLAHEHAIIIAACQIAFDAIGWSRRDMNHHHWQRLAAAIAHSPAGSGSNPAEAAVSLGHWPGHIEALQTAQCVVLNRSSRSSNKGSLEHL